MNKRLIPWIRKQYPRLIASLTLMGMAGLLTACATVPSGTSSANTALANERAAISDQCISAGVFGPVLTSLHQSGIINAANWVKIQDTYVTLLPICHPAGGTPNLSNYAAISLTVAQAVSTLAQYAVTTKQITTTQGAK